jgi:hypothetical protein
MGWRDEGNRIHSRLLPADFHLAAAEIFNFVGHTPLAEEMPETLDTTCTLMKTIDLFAKWLKEKGLH